MPTNGFKKNSDWSGRHCNPYNQVESKYSTCQTKGASLAIPEKPYIRGISYPRKSPFVNVETLRTPIDNLYFEIYSYDVPPIDDLEGTPFFECLVYKYQAYLPQDIFLKNKYYVVRCYAINDAGNSVWSNNYILDYSVSYHICMDSIGGLDGTEFYMDGIWRKDCIMFAKK